jgi:uncharacterized protein YbjT (DUF2867 family)
MSHLPEIAVAGGTGNIGREVVRVLAAAGHPVRVLSRRPPARPLPAGARHVRADVTDPALLRSALAGAQVVVDAVNTTDMRHAEAVLPAGTRALVAAATDTGAGHLVLVSVVGSERVPLGYYRGKVAQEETVAAGPVPWSIVRATQFHPLVAALLGGAARARIVPMGRVPLQPVDPVEAAEEVARVAAGPPLMDRVSFAGPQVRTLAELAADWRRASGAHGLRLPVELPGRAARALRAGALTDPAARRGRTTFTDWLAGAAP